MPMRRSAAALTRQLLAFSRQQVMQPKVVSLNQIVTDMQKMLQRLIGEDIDFSIDLAADLGSVLADPGQIEQVIMNLAANARDAMPRGGKLIIATRNVELNDRSKLRDLMPAGGRFVVLEVADNGIGMDAETQSHIFEPFFTTKPVGEGTGLGLDTVARIVRKHRGNVRFESKPGDTCFQVRLPIG